MMRFYSVLKSREGKPLNFGEIEKEIKKICKKYDLILFYIYGSYVSGKPWKMSDIDLAYFSEKDLGLRGKNEIEGGP